MPTLTLDAAKVQVAGSPLNSSYFEDNLYDPVVAGGTDQSLAIVNGRLDRGNFATKNLDVDCFGRNAFWMAAQVGNTGNCDLFQDLFENVDDTLDGGLSTYKDGHYLYIQGLTLNYVLPWTAKTVKVSWQLELANDAINAEDTPYVRFRYCVDGSIIPWKQRKFGPQIIAGAPTQRHALDRDRSWSAVHTQENVSAGEHSAAVRVTTYQVPTARLRIRSIMLEAHRG